MMNPRKEWFSLAIQDHALFHVALSHAAGNLGLLTQKGDAIESLTHRMEAIRIINERLDDLSCGISDGTIGAVASMASYEVSILNLLFDRISQGYCRGKIRPYLTNMYKNRQATNGTLEGIQTHMNGLEQMVRMRGGLQQGGFSAHLRRLIAWYEPPAKRTDKVLTLQGRSERRKRPLHRPPLRTPQRPTPANRPVRYRPYRLPALHYAPTIRHSIHKLVPRRLQCALQQKF
jgi:hypothetical protein